MKKLTILPILLMTLVITMTGGMAYSSVTVNADGSNIVKDDSWIKQLFSLSVSRFDKTEYAKGEVVEFDLTQMPIKRRFELFRKNLRCEAGDSIWRVEFYNPDLQRKFQQQTVLPYAIETGTIVEWNENKAQLQQGVKAGTWLVYDWIDCKSTGEQVTLTHISDFTVTEEVITELSCGDNICSPEIGEDRGECSADCGPAECGPQNPARCGNNNVYACEGGEWELKTECRGTDQCYEDRFNRATCKTATEIADEEKTFSDLGDPDDTNEEEAESDESLRDKIREVFDFSDGDSDGDDEDAKDKKLSKLGGDCSHDNDCEGTLVCKKKDAGFLRELFLGFTIEGTCQKPDVAKEQGLLQSWSFWLGILAVLGVYYLLFYRRGRRFIIR